MVELMSSKAISAIKILSSNSEAIEKLSEAK
jgi:hypothetical protein